MNINLTLVVQIINFLIAYVLMRKFLFRPVVACLQEEKAETDGLRSAITDGQRIVDQRKIDKRNRWANYQSFFVKVVPHISTERVVTQDIAIELLEVTESDVEKVAQHMHKVLVERVNNGNS